jgi:ADP-ribose pyrophosphatase YjhB (NUDIX family)
VADDFPLTDEQTAARRDGFKYCPQCRTPMIDKFVFGRTRRVCPSEVCHFVQFIDPKLTAAVMPLKDGRVLMVQRAMEPGRGSWCFPGGFMEMNETPQQTAIRECKEETGFDVAITGLIDVFYYEDYRGSGVVIMYQGDVVGGEAAISPHESQAMGFFAPDDLPQSIAFDSNIQALADWCKQAQESVKVSSQILPDNSSSLFDQILELEEKLLQPKIRSSAAMLDRLLAPDFVEFGSSGCSSNKRQMIRSLGSETSAEISIDNLQVKMLAPQTALATYRSSHGLAGGEGGKTVLRSSIWQVRDGRWQIIFHQGTLTNL